MDRYDSSPQVSPKARLPPSGYQSPPMTTEPACYTGFSESPGSSSSPLASPGLFGSSSPCPIRCPNCQHEQSCILSPAPETCDSLSRALALHHQTLERMVEFDFLHSAAQESERICRAELLELGQEERTLRRWLNRQTDGQDGNWDWEGLIEELRAEYERREEVLGWWRDLVT